MRWLFSSLCIGFSLFANSPDVEVGYFSFQLYPTSSDHFLPPLPLANYPTTRTYKGVFLAVTLPLHEHQSLLLSYFYSHKTTPYKDRPFFPSFGSQSLCYDLFPPPEEVTLTRAINTHLFQLQYLDCAFLEKWPSDSDFFFFTPRIGMRFCDLYQEASNQFSFFYLTGIPIEEERHFNSTQQFLGFGPQIGGKLLVRPFAHWSLLSHLDIFGEVLAMHLSGKFSTQNHYYVDSGCEEIPFLEQSYPQIAALPVVDLSCGLSYTSSFHTFDCTFSTVFFHEIWWGADRLFVGAPPAATPRNLSLSNGLLYSLTLTF